MWPGPQPNAISMNFCSCGSSRPHTWWNRINQPLWTFGVPWYAGVVSRPTSKSYWLAACYFQNGLPRFRRFIIFHGSTRHGLLYMKTNLWPKLRVDSSFLLVLFIKGKKQNPPQWAPPTVYFMCWHALSILYGTSFSNRLTSRSPLLKVVGSCYICPSLCMLQQEPTHAKLQIIIKLQALRTLSGHFQCTHHKTQQTKLFGWPHVSLHYVNFTKKTSNLKVSATYRIWIQIS